MSATSQQIQQVFAEHLRNPETNAAPDDIEDRRLQIYRDLLFNNIESFISSGFPILRSLHSDDGWHRLVRSFIDIHSSKSPYFLSLGSEFISYLEGEHDFNGDAPPFFLELARYELAELQLFVSEKTIPDNRSCTNDVLSAVPCLSPLAWPMLFDYPVHKIGVEFQPATPESSPVCIVVYRNREDAVKFLEANMVTARLLAMCDGNIERKGADLLEQIALEMQHPNPEVVLAGGRDTIVQMLSLDILTI